MRLPLLDLIRFLAALAVLAFHWTDDINGPFRLGTLGVPVFFMLSGYVVSLTMLGRNRWQFVTARLRRLYPTFWICLALTLLVVDPVPLTQILANATMMPLVLRAPYVDGVYWTLLAELMFYGGVMLFVPKPQWLAPACYLWLGAAILPLPKILDVIIWLQAAPFFTFGVGLYARDKILTWASLAWGAWWIYDLLGVWGGIVILVSGLAIMAAIRVKVVPGQKGLLILGGISYPLYLLHNEFGLAIGGIEGLALSFAAAGLVWAFDVYLLDRLVRTFSRTVRRKKVALTGAR